MSSEVEILYHEKAVEAAHLAASLTEPFATGGADCAPEMLAKDYGEIANRLESTFKALADLAKGMKANELLEPSELARARQRVSGAVSEASRAAQDFAAQIRFFEAMNPTEAAKVKPVLEKFDEIEKSSREFTMPEEGVEEGAELAPAETDLAPDEPDIDPMLM